MARTRPVKIIFLILGLILWFPGEGHVSGSFSTTWGDRYFIIHFDNQRHKIYRPETDVDGLYRQFQKNFLSMVEEQSSKRDNLFEQAGARKIPVTEIRLKWPEMVLLSPDDIELINPASYPLLLCLPVQPDNGRGLYHFKLALTGPVPARDLEWLHKELTQMVSKNDSCPDDDEIPLNTIDLDDYPYVNVIQTYTGHALYAGTLFHVARDQTDFFRDQLTAWMDRIGPELNREVSCPAFEKETGAHLISMDAVFGKDQGLCSGNFNPWGPIQDEAQGISFFRPRAQSPNTIVTALFAAKTDQWGGLSERITGLLEKLTQANPEQWRSVRTDLMIMQLNGKIEGSPYYFEPDVLDKGRMESALSTLLNNSQKTKEAQRNAMDQLAYLVDQRTTGQTIQAIVQYFASPKNEYSDLAQVIQVLGKIRSTPSARALIGLYLDRPLSDSGDTYFLRQDILTALKSTGLPAITLIEEALARESIQQQPLRVEELTAVLKALTR